MPLTLHSDSTCDICADEYGENGDGQTPAVLPCGHVLCRSCIQNMMVHNQPSYTQFFTHPLAISHCPFCRTRFLPNSDVRTLVCDYAPRPPPEPTPVLGLEGLPLVDEGPAVLEEVEEEPPDEEKLERERMMAKVVKLLRRMRTAVESEIAAGDEGARDQPAAESIRKARKFLTKREEAGDPEDYLGLAVSLRLLESFADQRARHADALKTKDASWMEYMHALNATWKQHTADLAEQNMTLRHQLAERLIVSAPAMPRLMSPPIERERSGDPPPLRSFAPLPDHTANPLPEPAKLVDFPLRDKAEPSRTTSFSAGTGSTHAAPGAPPPTAILARSQAQPEVRSQRMENYPQASTSRQASASTLMHDMARSQYPPPHISRDRSRELQPERAGQPDPELLRQRLEIVNNAPRYPAYQPPAMLPVPSSGPVPVPHAARQAMADQYMMSPPASALAATLPAAGPMPQSAATSHYATPASTSQYATPGSSYPPPRAPPLVGRRSLPAESVFTPTPAPPSAVGSRTAAGPTSREAEPSAILPAADDDEYVVSSYRPGREEATAAPRPEGRTASRDARRGAAPVGRSVSGPAVQAYPAAAAPPYPMGNAYSHHPHVHARQVSNSHPHGRLGGLWAPMDSDTEAVARGAARGY